MMARSRPYRLELYEAGYQQWRWRIRAGNGEIVVASTEWFASKASDRRNARLLGLAALAIR